MVQLPVVQPSSVTLMIKPVGALCNLDCTYCYYLPTKQVYDGREHRMSEGTLESIFAGYLPHAGQEVTICWQGGEPTLAGLKFFETAMRFQKKYSRPGQRVSNAIQTNGTLLDDAWGDFLRREQYLVGISVDGPPHFHDYYRLNNAGGPSHDHVMRGLKCLREHDVEYNILCVLNDRNVTHPDEVYRYLLNLGSRWLQFIPEIVFETDEKGQKKIAAHCPEGAAYGRFMNRVFDLWFEKHRQRISVRMFDTVLNKLVLDHQPLCILDGSCHGQLTIEHNGDVFGCDHFVEKRWQLARIGDADYRNQLSVEGDEESVGLTIHGRGYHTGHIEEGRDIGGADDVAQRYKGNTGTDVTEAVDASWFSRVDGSRLTAFARRKRHLPQGCVDCRYLTFCYGGCPEHRPHGGDVPEASVLCAGYIAFYDHAMERLQWLAGYLRRGAQPPPVQVNVDHGAATDSAIGRRVGIMKGTKIKRNAPCPCGSGLKYKNCCGKSA